MHPVEVDLPGIPAGDSEFPGFISGGKIGTGGGEGIIESVKCTKTAQRDIIAPIVVHYLPILGERRGRQNQAKSQDTQQIRQ
jgi:hypothetical protein